MESTIEDGMPATNIHSHYLTFNATGRARRK